MTPETSHKGVGEGDSGLPDCEFGGYIRIPDIHPTQHGPTHHPTVLPTDAKLRKQFPVHTGCMMYFPNALLCVAHQSWLGNQQHHPDKPLHWDKTKSADEPDAGLRHALEGDLVAKAWRALAELERALCAGYRPWPYLSPIPQDMSQNCAIVAQKATDVSQKPTDEQIRQAVRQVKECDNVSQNDQKAGVLSYDTHVDDTTPDECIPPEVAAGLPKLPDGWVYYGTGKRTNQWSGHARDVCRLLPHMCAWVVGGDGTSSRRHYALRRGSEIAKLNGIQ